jgi:DNA-binding NtrC family response regulator
LLIVDDDEEVAAELERVLSLEGYEVYVLACPRKALELITQTKIHIVLTDISLPDMDGIELLAAIRNFDPLTQVIMMTEDSTMDRTARCLENGATDYLFKPFSAFDEVIEAVSLAAAKLQRWQLIMRRNFA